MFEYLVEEEKETRKLDDNKAENVCSEIGNLWTNWDKAREKQKTIADKLRPEIYLDERKKENKNKKEEWKSDVHLNKIYALFQTQQAFVWDNIYSDVESLFDVAGKDEQSDANAKTQKTNLVNIFYQIGIQRKLDRAIENLGSIGELCLFIGWKSKFRQIRRKNEGIVADLMKVLFQSENYSIMNQKVYDGPSVEVINPIDLTFDPKVDPEDTDKWDNCGKIIKEWKTYDDIATNKLYKLSKSQLKEIKDLLNQKSEDEDKDVTEKSDETIQENRIEVLEYWGDYTMEDGTVLRNWSAIVIGRKYLALFEHNRWVINPIINMALFRDSQSKRGIPEIWSIYDLSKEQEKKVNLQNDAQTLNLNPPAYAPEGFFTDKDIQVEPGKQIEYKGGLDDPNSIVKMQFPLFDNEQIIQYYDSTASTVSGIFPNMQGQADNRDATATEIKVKVQGQTTRLAKALDNIKQNAIVPMVTKVADLDANMKFGDETIYTELNGVRVTETVGDTVRQGNYEYKYTDSNGLYRKASRNQELIQILQNVWNDPSVPLNKVEIVKDALKNADFENIEKYFMEQMAPAQLPAPAPLPEQQGEEPEPQPQELGDLMNV